MFRNLWVDIYKRQQTMAYFNQDNHNSSILQLNINGKDFIDKDESFIDRFESIFSTVYFTRLNIDCKSISVRMFAKILHLLPNLDSLKVLSLPPIQSSWLSDDHDGQIHFLTAINNRITKVNFEKMICIEQVHFLLKVCPCIEYFQMGVPNNMDLEMLVRFLLLQSNTYYSHLNSLCLSVSNANRDMVDQLKRLIQSEKLLSNYGIEYIYNSIVLKWN